MYRSRHQIGFFRDLHVNIVNENRRERPNQQPENQPNANPQPEQTTQPNPAPAEEATNDTTPRNENQSLLAVTWMIFTSFFASLIPDTN